MILSVSTVDAILRDEDIEGLLALGAPVDEYSGEAAAIRSGLEQLREDQLTEAHVSALVMDIWDSSFGPFSAEDIRKRQPILRHLVYRVLDQRFARPGGESSEAAAGFDLDAGGK